MSNINLLTLFPIVGVCVARMMFGLGGWKMLRERANNIGIQPNNKTNYTKLALVCFSFLGQGKEMMIRFVDAVLSDGFGDLLPKLMGFNRKKYRHQYGFWW